MPRSTDTNHARITEALRDLGCTVHDTHTVADGFPDLVVGIAGRTVLVEVKADWFRRLTPAQERWHARWKGDAPRIVTTVEECVELVQEVLVGN